MTDEREAPAPKTSCCIPEALGCLLPTLAVLFAVGTLVRRRRGPR